MKILAVETSTIIGGVAILDDDKLIAEGRLGIKSIHSERLMCHIDFLLKSSRLELSDIDFFAVSVGPGSFTGLRVGISTVKGLAFATNKMIAPVSSLEALALNVVETDHYICPVIDARKGEVYTSIYKSYDTVLHTIVPETVLSPVQLTKLIDKKTILLGDGITLYGNLLKDALGDRVIFCHSLHNLPSAANVAFLARAKIIKKEMVTANDLNAKYIRRSEAEIRFGSCGV